MRSLNTIREALDPAATPGYQIWALKREELIAMGSVALHELYFGNLGGDGKIGVTPSAMLEEAFGSVAAWRSEFVGAARALGGGAGWVLLTYSRRDRRLWNQIASDHSQTLVDASPVLALDMYEHAYHLDFRANTTAYVDAFMRNIDWTVVVERTRAARDDRPPVREHGAEDALPSLSVEELSAQLAKGERVQVLDARPRHYFSKATDMMQGAVWRIRSGLRNGSASYRPTRSSSCPAPTGTTSVAA